MVWLRCQTPFIEERETILGLLECDDQQPRDIPIDFYAWNSTSVKDSNAECTCQRVPSAFSRRRVALQHISATPPLIDNQVRRTLKSACFKPAVHWLDFRAVTNFSLSSDSEVAHFLRSVLGASEHISPWTSTAGENQDSISNHRTLLHEGDCAIVVFPKPIPEKLEYFRVSDICPSWSLYSMLSAELPTLKSAGGVNALNFPWNEMQQSFENLCPRESCVLFVFRKLPEREYLSSLHPETRVRAPNGCLWESLVTYPPIEEEKEPIPYYEYRLVSPPYIEPLNEFPYLEKLIKPDSLKVIQQEALSIPQWTAWPEQQHYKVSDNGATAPWHVFPLCHCFPADNPTNLKWITLTCAHVPRTVALLKKVVGGHLRTALFSRLDPESVLEAHTGWSDLANYVYRVHLPLQVPPGGLCGTWVDGCVETHEVGRLQAFDDSKTHRAFNYSSYDRVVLILDVARPTDLPLGTAEGGHSDELDKFIEQMGGSN
ncbi:hypothetical protein FisN_1Lh156 [Fistulifera solaris]|uniref:Aspartyl/asparaginy/proline hydroxylase domain-containing protein n=1 Tax=Fistulifera solaris TaxID=1519565 RepID=A0A1Z5K5E9_FISSO|nr:hypothetical protein FisN_1Lh156 [Fistulifera solaris]|eukprot:GAX21321.1 hypothetical protein FisN_1Lh156 [Fistulifera solaris]